MEKFDEIILVINKGQHKLRVDASSFDYTQVLRKCTSINKSLKLGLRKVGAQPFYARRIGGKWNWNTFITFTRKGS